MMKFIRETKGEFDKVIWPKRNVYIDATALVIILSIAVGIYLGIFDIIVLKILHIIIGI